MPKDTGPNMEMRALLAIVLSLVVLSLYQYLFVPAAPPTAPPTAATASSPEAEPVPLPRDLAPVIGASAAVVSAEQVQQVTIATPLFTAELSNQGARITSFVLEGYDADDGGTLDLVEDVYAKLALPLDLVTPEAPELAERANAGLYVVTVDATTRSPTGLIRLGPGESVGVRMRWGDTDGWAVEKALTFHGDSYQVGVEVSVRTADATPTFITVGPGLVRATVEKSSQYLRNGAVLLQGTELVQVAASDLEAAVPDGGPLSWDDRYFQGGVRWAGQESYYFLAAFLLRGTEQARIDVVPLPPDAPVEAAVATRTGVLVPDTGFKAPLFLGPKKYSLLVAEGNELQKAITFGMFGIIGRPLLLFLVWIYGFVGNYGVAIIVMTLVIRAVFLPLNQKSMLSMRKMQGLQPQMAAIRAKYKDARAAEKRQAMNQEVMQLYKKHGVSPFGGCLPMLVQMPVLFSLFSLLSVAIELRRAPLALWIGDLSAPDPFFVLPLLMGASMFYQMRQTPVADPNQARINKILPIVFLTFFLWAPSGLVLYWFVNNLLHIGQQAYINREVSVQDPPPTRGWGKGKKKQRGKR